MFVLYHNPWSKSKLVLKCLIVQGWNLQRCPCYCFQFLVSKEIAKKNTNLQFLWLKSRCEKSHADSMARWEKCQRNVWVGKGTNAKLCQQWASKTFFKFITFSEASEPKANVRYLQLQQVVRVHFASKCFSTRSWLKLCGKERGTS